MTRLHSVPSARSTPRERAAIVGLASGSDRRRGVEGSLAELAGLASAAGALVVVQLIQERGRPDPALFLGKGKVELLARACDEANVDLVIVDNELSPAQLRNLEGELHRKIVDRTQLILDIFAGRARTREGKLQVELAQLRYLLPRLVGASTALSRLGGGIGTRGPGETKLETDRRRIRRRIGSLARVIESVRRRRSYLRERRHKASIPTVALVGYANAGKTTLFNLLTKSEAETSAVLFATLDPLIRQVRLSDRRTLLISDTVGFVDRLPHTLVAAFRATLEEVTEADLLLHVIDASHPEQKRQSAAVRRVLEEVGAEHVPCVDVFNKCDRLDAAEYERLERCQPEGCLVSALSGTGRGELVDTITARLALDMHRVLLEFDATREEDRRQIGRLYRHGRVLRHLTVNGQVSIEAEVPGRLLRRFEATAIGSA